MENLHIPLLFVPTFILLSCSITSVSSISQLQTASNQCRDDQRSALVELQHGVYSSQNFTFISKAELWNVNTDCCSWKGVTCDVLGHVIGLNLNDKNLSGGFQSIFNLHHLQKLNLAGNNFNTSLSPSRFDKLPNLTHLNLSASCFHGQVPLEISYMTRLVSLDLSSQDMCYRRNYQTVDYNYDQTFDHYYYQTVGHIIPTLRLEKPNMETIIKNMKSLTKLYLDRVNISTKSSKWCETISLALPRLRVLGLSSCGLTGPFCSSLSRLQFLSQLNLNDNPISYLPHNFLDIASRLVSLSLVNCSLSGHFPTKVILSPKMKSIHLSENDQLMGQLPEFPSNSNLEVLSLSMTNFSGILPESIGNLRFLTSLNIYDCHFSGPIPSSLANLTNLVRLNLASNNFSGPIPPFHRSGVPNLSYLSLSDNQLSGHVHSSIFTLPSLQTLRLWGNQLVGEIDEFVNASSSLMKYVDVSSNYLRGSIPKSIFHLPMLETLFIGYNSFDSMKLDMFFQIQNLWSLDLSNISLSIGSDNNKSLNFPQLEALWLSSCNLTEFPEFIKTQERLAFLDLSENQLHGSVPNWLWKKSLQFLALSDNHLSYLDQFLPNQSLTYSQGSSPRPICNMSQLEYFDASYNNLSGPIPNCLNNIRTLYRLELQGNNFTGSLPNFAEATNLQLLRVGENRLEGKLPTSLASCTNLEVFDVGNNMVIDTFPFWLGKLPALKVLVLRENRFYGEIKHLLEHENIFPALDVLDIASNDFSGELSLDFCLYINL